MHRAFGVDFISAVQVSGSYQTPFIPQNRWSRYNEETGYALRWLDPSNEPDVGSIGSLNQNGQPCYNVSSANHYSFCWTPALLSYYQQTVPQYKNVAHLPILGPSYAGLDSGFAADASLQALVPYYDYNNLHDYSLLQHPENAGTGSSQCSDPNYVYNSVPCAISNYLALSASKPTISTEMGNGGVYPGFPAGSGPGSAGQVPESAQAVYENRYFLYHLLQGEVAAYQFAFDDSDSDNGCTPTMVQGGGSCFGIVSQAGVPKPSYFVLQSMIRLLTDKGYSFVPGTLNYSISAAPFSAYHMLAQNHKGTYILILWNGISGYDSGAYTVTTNAPVPITVTVDSSIRSARLNTYNASYGLDQTMLTPSSGSTYNINLTDQVQFLELSSLPVIP
jgi:hypothetical protein